jgi:uncharacterized protein
MFTIKIYLLTFFLISNAAIAASFDCAKAKSSVEKTICNDSELSKLDEELSRVYKSALLDYPVENYLRVRQRDWIKLNTYCDKTKFVACLRENYKERIKKLSDIRKVKVYSNTDKFSYENGDAVAEIRQEGNRFTIDIWGGARFHRQFSIDSGRDVYNICEFEGSFTSPSGGKAVGNGGSSFVFSLIGNKITYEDDRQNCPGFASLPESMYLMAKK